MIIPGYPMAFKTNDAIEPVDDERLMPENAQSLIEQIYQLFSNRSMKNLMECGDEDFSFSIKGLGRFRCNAYKQRTSLAAVLRLVYFSLPDYRELNIPETVMEFANKKKGMVLVTGSAGSGKSTTFACIIDRINNTRKSHIITIEDRIVDVFPADQQRQVRIQLSMVLEGVVSQQLIPTVSGGLAPAFEIMKVNPAIRNLIREGKTHQIENAIFSGGAEGMRTMDNDILSLYKQGILSKENALLYAVNPKILEKKL